MSNEHPAKAQAEADSTQDDLRSTHLTKGESCFNRFSFWYTNKIIIRGNMKPYKEEDLFKLGDDMVASIGFPQFLKYWQDNKATKSLPSIMISYKGWLYWMGTWLFAANYVILVVGPFCVSNIIKWLKEPNAPASTGWIWLSILIVIIFVKSWCMIMGNAMLAHSVVRLIQNMRNLIRWKVSRLSPAARNYADFGSVSSLIMVDVFRFDPCFMRAYHLLSTPGLLMFLLVYLVLEIGWVGILAPGLMTMIIICQKFLND